MCVRSVDTVCFVARAEWRAYVRACVRARAPAVCCVTSPRLKGAMELANIKRTAHHKIQLLCLEDVANNFSGDWVAAFCAIESFAD